MASQTPTNVNQPPPGQSWVDKLGQLSAALKAWFGALGGTTGNWSVGGILSATGATLLTGALTLTALVGLPANGQIGAGDALWTEIGSGGSAPAFQNGFTNQGNPRATAAFRKLPTGLVKVKGTVLFNGAGLNMPIWTFPAGYLPLQDEIFSVDANGGYGRITIQASTGHIFPDVGNAGANLCLDNIQFYAER